MTKIFDAMSKIFYNPKVNQTLVPQAFDPFDPIALYISVLYAASLELLTQCQTHFWHFDLLKSLSLNGHFLTLPASGQCQTCQGVQVSGVPSDLYMKASLYGQADLMAKSKKPLWQKDRMPKGQKAKAKGCQRAIEKGKPRPARPPQAFDVRPSASLPPQP